MKLDYFKNKIIALEKAIESKNWKKAYKILDVIKEKLPEFALIQNVGNSLADIETTYFNSLDELLETVDEIYYSQGEIDDDVMVCVEGCEFWISDYESIEELRKEIEENVYIKKMNW